MRNIDIADTVYFYDDRNKYDWMYKLKTVLYSDDEMCVCVAKCTSLDEEIPDEKIIFKIENGAVINSDFSSWYATNDIELVQYQFDDWLESREVNNTTL